MFIIITTIYLYSYKIRTFKARFSSYTYLPQVTGWVYYLATKNDPKHFIIIWKTYYFAANKALRAPRLSGFWWQVIAQKRDYRAFNKRISD